MQSSEPEAQDVADYDNVEKKIKMTKANSADIARCSSGLKTAISDMSQETDDYKSAIGVFEFIPELKPLAMRFRQQLLGYAKGLILFCQTQQGNLRFHQNSPANE
jgi:hypothetical protein